MGQLSLGTWLEYLKQVFILKIQIPFTCKLFITYDLLMILICNWVKFPLYQAISLKSLLQQTNRINTEYYTLYTE